MNLEERVSALEANLEAARLLITALLGASQEAGKVSLLLNLFAQQFEENPSASPSFSTEQRKIVMEWLSRYEANAILVSNAVKKKEGGQVV